MFVQGIGESPGGKKFEFLETNWNFSGIRSGHGALREPANGAQQCQEEGALVCSFFKIPI